MYKIIGDKAHDDIVARTKQKLAFDENKPLEEQRRALKEKLCELSGLNLIKENACALNYEIEWEERKDGYKVIRFVFESEKDFFVPCYLLIPTAGKKKYPVAITLQGHKSGGMYNSIGIVKDEDDEEYQPRGAFALQAVRNGYAALCVEMRGMGELKPEDGPRSWGGVCTFTGLAGLLIGRTLLAERVWDIMRAIDVLEKFDELDTEHIVITGNSGGGTASFYAGCLDERITLCAPSCAFCSYTESILSVMHCVCNYIPKAYEWFEMYDLAALIAPRNLLVIAGEHDRIFKLEGVKAGFEVIRKIYQKADAEDKCRLLVTPKDHYWCEDLVWKAINEEMAKILG